VTVTPAGVTADFALVASARALSEVVVVGYGTTSRQNVSSAIASVTAEEIANAPIAGVDAALQGKAPGVQVIQNAGNPGNGVSIRVRGPASINAGNQPLYVVDGVPILQENYTQLGLGGQDITGVTGINPDEIETIDILKDAAAAAIYGSRGSNGVVHDHDRSAAAREVEHHVQRLPRMAVGAGDDSDAQRAAVRRDLQREREERRLRSRRLRLRAGLSTTPASFDWQKDVFRNSPVRDLQLGASGGSERMLYLPLGSYFDQKESSSGRSTRARRARLNLDFNANSKLTVRSSLGLGRETTAAFKGDGSPRWRRDERARHAADAARLPRRRQLCRTCGATPLLEPRRDRERELE
jgi:TonB-dependent SusC/RagA subfamily outer membrane receptor